MLERPACLQILVRTPYRRSQLVAVQQVKVIRPMKITAGILLMRLTRAGSLQILLVRSKAVRWSLPKGKVRRGEALAAAARRELNEETQLTCHERLVPLGYVENAKRTERFYCYQARCGEDEMPLASAEVQAARFVSLPTAAKMLHKYQLPIIESLLCLFKLTRKTEQSKS